MARHAILPFEFIRVQLVFADRLAELYKSDQADALTRETILPSLMISSLADGKAHPAWLAFLEGYASSGYDEMWAYDHYLKREPLTPDLDESGGFGCFWYGYRYHGRPDVRIHFRNVDRSGDGALSRAREKTRSDEIRAMFSVIAHKHPDAMNHPGLTGDSIS